MSDIELLLAKVQRLLERVEALERDNATLKRLLEEERQCKKSSSD